MMIDNQAQSRPHLRRPGWSWSEQNPESAQADYVRFGAIIERAAIEHQSLDIQSLIIGFGFDFISIKISRAYAGR